MNVNRKIKHQTSETVLTFNYKIRPFLGKYLITTLFSIGHEEVLKVSLKWHEIDIWLLTHKVEMIMFRRT
jgi:hypothetical protein